MNAIHNTDLAGKTCTVVVGGDAYWCGKPAATLFVGRSGVTYYECAEHAYVPATEPAVESPAHPPTRTTRAYVLVSVATGKIVGYADSKGVATTRRARRLGAEIVAVVR